MAVIKNVTPEKRVQKAGKRVGKALSVFDNAANELDRAAAEQLAAVEQYEVQADTIRKDAHVRNSNARAAAYDAYITALDNADDEFDGELDLASSLDELGAEVENSALQSQLQADNLRTLLSVA